MIESPRILTTSAQHAAVIRVTVPRERIQHVVGPGIEEVLATVAAQGIEVAGAWFTRHLRIPGDTFEMEIGVPVARPVQPAGRVVPVMLPAQRVARTVHAGCYGGLPQAWDEFRAWVEQAGHATRLPVWESYVLDPSTSADPARWRTELNWPLAGEGADHPAAP